MPQQKRQPQPIEESEKKSGKSAKRAAQIAYATLNKNKKKTAARAAKKSSSRTQESRAH